MPLYEISPHHGRSYSSPFHNYGLGDDPSPPAAVPVTKTTSDVVMKDTEETDYMAFLSPVIAGVVMAIMAYGVARKFNVEKDKAVGLSVTMGGVTALGHGLSNWLFKHTEPIRQSLPGASVGPIAAGDPNVAQIVPVPNVE